MSGPAPAAGQPADPDPGKAPSSPRPIASIALGRPIFMLAATAFVSVATMRVADPLLPQVAEEFAVSAGDAAVIATTFSFAYGFCQLAYGALGDRFGKYLLVALAALVSAVTVSVAAFAGSLAMLGIARLAAGATAAAIVPMSMAFIGDHVPYAERQAALARFMTGTILGTIAGQVLGGVLGDLIGWRAVFLVLAGLFVLMGGLLLMERRLGHVPRPLLSDPIGVRSLIAAYARLLRGPWARVVLATVFVEGFLFYGAFAFIGAHLRASFQLDYTVIGLLLGFMGLGAMLYALSARRLVGWLGERGLALAGAVALVIGFAAIALGPLAVMAPSLALLGLGFIMLHNTLQTNATQMAPEARGIAVSTFASALFLGQAAGVWLGGLLVDQLGFTPLFLIIGPLLLVLGILFAVLLGRRPATG